MGMSIGWDNCFKIGRKFRSASIRIFSHFGSESVPSKNCEVRHPPQAAWVAFPVS